MRASGHHYLTPIVLRPLLGVLGTLLLVLLLLMVGTTPALAINWDHAVYLNDDFRLLWSLKQQDITFEVQVRTGGYVGLGFSADGAQAGADMAVGWIDQGQTYFQDRHMKKTGDGEPFVDPQQDYELLLGYENATHTVMRFRRRLNTCDTAHDIIITNDTMRVMFMYHPSEPAHGSVVPGSLPDPQAAFRGYVPLSLMQRLPNAPPATTSPSSSAAQAKADDSSPLWLELRHEDVELPAPDETRFWCRVFELPTFRKRHHLIRYEPVFETPRSREFLQQIVLYECQGASAPLVTLSRRGAHVCQNHNNPAVPCNAVVAVWSRGSQGFTFPPDAGYPFESAHGRFYLMESHYNNPVRTMGDWEAAVAAQHLGPVVDNSGLRLLFTPSLRKHDAGVVSIGMDPNWRLIIPPGHEQVISEGHCIDECTQRTLPAAGISIFAVLMQTYNIGSAIRLRQIRRHDELQPIAVDAGVHGGYAEFRRVAPVARVLPGDSLIVECTYNSSARDSIMLGGLTTRGETCNALAVYYPRQKQLSTCRSVPSLPTVLHSLGIEELSVNSQPVLIALPKALRGMSLEDRLLSYDWKLQFDSFQRVMRSGSFQAVCLDAQNSVIADTDTREHYRPSIGRSWLAPATADMCPASAGGDDALLRSGTTTAHRPPDSNNVYVTEMATRRKNFDGDAEVESMSLSGAQALGVAAAGWMSVATTVAVYVFVIT